MQKVVIAPLVLALCLTLVCACESKEEVKETIIQTDATIASTVEETIMQTEETVIETSEAEEIEEVEHTDIAVSAWTLTDANGVYMPEDALEAFNAVGESFVGIKYTPIAYLGSQVVAGTNYGFLCRATDDAGESSPHVITVYKDPDGNASILMKKLIMLGSCVANDSPPTFIASNTAGSWCLNNEYMNDMPTGVQFVFNSAMSDFEGDEYRPITYLGWQETNNGYNYAILCSVTPSAEGYDDALAVVMISANTSAGTSAISSISGFSF